MKPARFDYVRADDVAEVHAVLAEHGNDARVVAGGQTLLPMLSMRLVRPKVVIDIMHLPALRKIEAGGNEIRIGAGVRQAELLAWPDFPRAAAAGRGVALGRSRANAQPRHRLRVGGACRPECGNSAGFARARRRRSSCPRAGGAARVAASRFFTGMMSTERGDEELIEAVIIPKQRPGHGYAFQEFGRRHGDFAIVSFAAVWADSIRLAVGGVGDRPVARDFPMLDDGALNDALDAFAWELDARDDLHATARYRRELVRRMGRATIEEARQCRA